MGREFFFEFAQIAPADRYGAGEMKQAEGVFLRVTQAVGESAEIGIGQEIAGIVMLAQLEHGTRVAPHWFKSPVAAFFLMRNEFEQAVPSLRVQRGPQAGPWLLKKHYGS